MSISDLYSSGAHERNIGHFANIVKLALSNDIISEEEQVLLNKMAKRLDISKSEYEKILKDPSLYPINPPVDYERRIERLFNLAKMVFADGEAGNDQINFLNKITIGLGFSTDHYKAVTSEAIELIMRDTDLEDFTKAIKKVN